MNQKQKAKWICALGKLYNQYTTELLHPSLKHHGMDCPLCSIAWDQMIKPATPRHSMCNTCIHTNKEFGQGKKCTLQKSFQNITLHSKPYTSQRRTSILHRRAYILRMREKLIKSYL